MTVQSQDPGTDDSTQDPTTPATLTPQQEIDKLVQAGIDAALKPIKDKLDAAYSKREAAEKKVEEFEKKARDAELLRLQEEGKHKEAAEMQITEERRLRQAAESKVINLTRDLEVRNVLGAQDFRNDIALEMAYKEIAGQLIQNESGAWVHRSGVTIKDFVKAFAENEDNAFLFKTKASSGGGSTTSKVVVPPTGQKKSLFDMSQDEVLKMAEAGKLRNRNK